MISCKKNILYKKVFDMNLLTKAWFSLLFVASCISLNLQANTTEKSPLSAELQNLRKKYSSSPDKKCAECKKTEDCLKLVLHTLQHDPMTLQEDILRKQLDDDSQAISQVQKDAQNYWLWQTQELADKDTFAKNCLNHLENTRHFLFFSNKKYIQGHTVINFYKDMPRNKNEICSWIKNNRLSHTNNPLQEYKKICSMHLEVIRNITQDDTNNYPSMSYELRGIKDDIQDSLQIIETQYETEQVKMHEDQRKNAESKARIDEINAKTYASNMLAHKIKTEIKTALRKAEAKEEIAKKISQLISITKQNINNNELTQQSIFQIQRKIDTLATEVQQDEDVKINLHAIINEHKKTLKLQCQYHELLKQIEFYKNTKKNLQQKINETKKELAIIESQLQQNKQPITNAQHQKLLEKYNNYKKDAEQLTQNLMCLQQSIDQLFQRIAHENKPAIAQAQLTSNLQKRNLPIAQAVPVNSGDFYNGPIAEATVIPEKNSHCEKR